MRTVMMVFGAFLFFLTLLVTISAAISWMLHGNAEMANEIFKYFCVETVGFVACCIGIGNDKKGDEE